MIILALILIIIPWSLNDDHPDINDDHQDHLDDFSNTLTLELDDHGDHDGDEHGDEHGVSVVTSMVTSMVRGMVRACHVVSEGVMMSRPLFTLSYTGDPTQRQKLNGY